MRRNRFAVATLPLVIGLITCARDEATAPHPIGVPTARAARAVDPASERILFYSNRDGRYHIYSIRPDGTGLTQLTFGAADDVDPAWSPDGTRIAFSGGRDTVPGYAVYSEIYVMNADGTGMTRVTQLNPTPGPGQGIRLPSHPSWSPDGQHIAFAANANGTWIFTVNVDGSGLRCLVCHGDLDGWPSWSPDGARIVWAPQIIGYAHWIAVANADGTGYANLTDSYGGDTAPSAKQPVWSPDGSKILYVGQTSFRLPMRLSLMNPDGSGKTVLNGTFTGTEPSWSPDGSRIVSVVSVGGHNQLYVMNADGSSPTRITNDTLDYNAPNWGFTAGGQPQTVASVVVTPSSTTEAMGQSLQLTATAYDNSGHVISGKTAAWTSSDPTIVRFDGASGAAHAVGVGSVTVTATMDGVPGQANVSATGVAISSISIDPATVTGAAIGMSGQFRATLHASDGSVLTGRPIVWASSAKSVVTVNDTGYASAVGYGNATISATSAGVVGQASVQVAQIPGKVNGIRVHETADTSINLEFNPVDDGTGHPAYYGIRYAAGSTIDWGSASYVRQGSCSYAYLPPLYSSPLCTVAGLRPGTVYSFQIVSIRDPYSDNPVFGPLSDVITDHTRGTAPADSQVVNSVTVDPASVTAPVGASGPFTATARDGYGRTVFGRTVVWTSSDPTIVTIDSAGNARAVSAGSVTITATVDGVVGTSQVTITP